MTAPDRSETTPEHEPETGPATSPETSTPEAAQDHTGSDHATHGANTNLTPDVQGGPTRGEDRAATETITDQHAHQGGNQSD